jgi:hypothetical protein
LTCAWIAGVIHWSATIMPQTWRIKATNGYYYFVFPGGQVEGRGLAACFCLGFLWCCHQAVRQNCCLETWLVHFQVTYMVIDRLQDVTLTWALHRAASQQRNWLPPGQAIQERANVVEVTVFPWLGLGNDNTGLSYSMCWK